MSQQKTAYFLQTFSAVSKNPDQLAEVSVEVSAEVSAEVFAEVSASFAEVSASFAEVSAVHSQKLPRFTHGNLHETIFSAYIIKSLYFLYFDFGWYKVDTFLAKNILQ